MSPLISLAACALRQAAHFAGHHGKPAPLLARTGCFYRSVQRQDVGLKGNAINHANDVCNLLAAVVDAPHGADHFRHHVSPAHGNHRGIGGQLAGLTGVVGIGLHGRAEFFHRGGGLFQCAGLLLGAHRKIVVALGDFSAGTRHAIGVGAHPLHHQRQAALHVVQGVEQLGNFIAPCRGGCHGQITFGHGL